MPPNRPDAPGRVMTPRGEAHVYSNRYETPTGLLVLGHGAGGGVEAPDLLAARDGALAAGWSVVRVLQPYRVAGRRSPPPTAHLDDAWEAVLDVLRHDLPPADTAPTSTAVDRLPLVVGGRSSGARVACRTAVAAGAAGVLALAFPLVPPGRPASTHGRHEELARQAAARIPVLVVQGDRDAFGIPAGGPGLAVHVVPGADHALRTAAARATVTREVQEWLSGLAASRSRPARRSRR